MKETVLVLLNTLLFLCKNSISVKHHSTAIDQDNNVDLAMDQLEQLSLDEQRRRKKKSSGS